LSEENLSRWPTMSAKEQLALYRLKLDAELDNQRRLMQLYGSNPEIASKAEFQRKLLQQRLAEVRIAQQNPGVRPDWLEQNQLPRLFSKGWTGAQEAARLGFDPVSEDGYRWVYRQSEDKLAYERMNRRVVQRYYDPTAKAFRNSDTNLLGARFRGNPISQGWANQTEQAEAARLATERLRLANRRDALLAIPDKNLTPAQRIELTQLRAAVNEHSRQLGEMAGTSFIRSRYGNQAKLRWPPAGKGSTPGDFDQIWEITQPDGSKRFIVVEAKGGSSSLGTRRVNGGRREAEQGSREYFDEIRAVMSRSQDPSSKKVANDLLRALRSDSIEYLEVRAPINGRGQSTGVKVEEFDLTPRNTR
jgi:hypothetical protein